MSPKLCPGQGPGDRRDGIAVTAQADRGLDCVTERAAVCEPAVHRRRHGVIDKATNALGLSKLFSKVLGRYAFPRGLHGDQQVFTQLGIFNAINQDGVNRHTL